MMTALRLKQEALALEMYFPKRCMFRNIGESNPYLDFGIKSTVLGRVYRAKISLDHFPYSCPDVYITEPSYLKMRDGTPLQRTDHHYHILGGGNNGETKLCHYSAQNWDSSIALYHVVLKAKIWIEAYEGHLLTGNTIDYYVKQYK